MNNKDAAARAYHLLIRDIHLIFLFIIEYDRQAIIGDELFFGKWKTVLSIHFAPIQSLFISV